jgi:hypothetical protein
MNVRQAFCPSFRLLMLSLFCLSPAYSQNNTGDVVVRVDDTSGTHCIDATTERVTLFVRRVFTEKNKGWFTEDQRAGVLVRSQLSGSTTSGQSTQDANVQVPNVDMVSVKDDKPGRVSLALEYPIASGFVLKQGGTLTKNIELYMNLAKTKGKTTFGDVLDLAGKALNQMPIPPNPYTQAGSKILKFANDAVDSSIQKDNDDQIAHIGLQFNEGAEPDIKKCESAGNERTGAVAVLRSVGIQGAQLISVTNTDRDYCFRYSSGSTYELLAAKRNGDGSCPGPSAFSGVPNDYVMLLISAQPIPKAGKSVVTPDAAAAEARNRCQLLHLPVSACGLH